MGNEMSQEGEDGMVASGGPPGSTVNLGAIRPQTAGVPHSTAGQTMTGSRLPQQHGSFDPRAASSVPPQRFQGPHSSRPQSSPYVATTQQQSISRSPSQGATIQQTSPMMGPMPTRSVSGPAISAMNGPPEVDLSNLSEEERAIIESVMARAVGITAEPNEQQAISKTTEETSRNGRPSLRQEPSNRMTMSEQSVKKCPLCQMNELKQETSECCTECQAVVCWQCGRNHSTNDNKRPIWLCHKCLKSVQRQMQASSVNSGIQQRSSSVTPLQPEETTLVTKYEPSASNRNLSRQSSQHGNNAIEDSRIVVPPGKSKKLSQNNHLSEEEPLSESEYASEIQTEHIDELEENGEYIGYRLKDEDDRYDILDDPYQDHEYIVKEAENLGRADEYIDAEDDSDEDDLPHHMLQPLPYYDHSPGEVYTIPEEEEEDNMSPSFKSDITSDTLSSLRRWRGMNQPYENYVQVMKKTAAAAAATAAAAYDPTSVNHVHNQSNFTSSDQADGYDVMKYNDKVNSNRPDVSEDEFTSQISQAAPVHKSHVFKLNDIQKVNLPKHGDSGVSEENANRPNSLEILRQTKSMEEKKSKKLVEPVRKTSDGGIAYQSLNQQQHQRQRSQHDTFHDENNKSAPKQMLYHSNERSGNKSRLQADGSTKRANESLSPEFATSGAGMAISNLLASQEKQLLQQKSSITGGPLTLIQGSTITVACQNHKAKPKVIDIPQQLQSKQKQSKVQKPTPADQDWSPVTDLSPIIDVSPSVEQAEQELIQHYNEEKSQKLQPANHTSNNMNRSTTGTISGMIADFSKALGLGKSASPNPSPNEESKPSIQTSTTVTTTTTAVLSATTSGQNNVGSTSAKTIPSTVLVTTTSTNGVAAPSSGGIIHTDINDGQSIKEQQQKQPQQHPVTTAASQQSQHKHNHRNQEKQQKQQTKVSQSSSNEQQSATKSKHSESKQPKQADREEEHQSRHSHISKKVHRKLPQPTVEQMHAALASSASARHKGVPQKAVAMVTASGSITTTVSATPQPIVSSMSRRTVEGRAPMPQMGTNVMKVEGFQHQPDHQLTSSVDDSRIHLGSVFPSRHSHATSLYLNYPQGSSANQRITAVPPYRVMDASTPRLRPDGKESPMISPDDYLVRASSASLMDYRVSPSSVYTPSMSVGSGPMPYSSSGLPKMSVKDKADSDTQSETDSCKSGKVRRKLPPIPRDQTPSPIPTRKARAKSMSAVSRQAYQQQASTQKESSFENGGYKSAPSIGMTRPSASDTNLQQLGMAQSDDDIRMKGMTEYSRDPTDFGKYKGVYGSDSNIYGMKLPSYMQTLKHQLKEELKIATADRRRFIDGLEDSEQRSSNHELRSKHYLTDPMTQNLTSMNERKLGESELSTTLRLHQQQTPKSYEYESLLSETNRQLDGSKMTGGMDTVMSPNELKNVRETAIDSIGDYNSLENAYKSLGLRPYHTLERDRMCRRLTKSAQSQQYEQFGRDTIGLMDAARHMERKSRKPRSWHPSPYVSEDEDDQMTREEKKAHIKAEIARRRMQIEENARLHEELLLLAKYRDGDGHARTSSYQGRTIAGPGISYPSPRSYESMSTASSRSYSYSSLSDKESNILKSIDEMLRRDYGRIYSGRYGGLSDRSMSYGGSHSVPFYEQMSGASSAGSRGSSPSQYAVTAEDLSIQRIASTFPADTDYSMASVGDRYSDFSPMTTDTDTPPDFTPAMPLLPDLPTKSRKLLEDLGSSPIASEPSTSGQPRTSRSGKVDANRGYEKDSRQQQQASVQQSRKQQQQKQQRQIQELPDEQPFSDHTRRTGTNQRIRQQEAQQRKAHASSVLAQQEYKFPVKRYLLTRDPKDKSVSGNGLGMKVIGGKEIPGSTKEIGAYVAKIYPGGVVDKLGEIKEGDQILEWNNVPLTNKTYEEVHSIITAPTDEVEIVVRCNFSMSSNVKRIKSSDHSRSKRRSQKQEITTMVEQHQNYENDINIDSNKSSSCDNLMRPSAGSTNHDCRKSYDSIVDTNRSNGPSSSPSIARESVSNSSLNQSICSRKVCYYSENSDGQRKRPNEDNEVVESDRMEEPHLNILNNNVQKSGDYCSSQQGLQNKCVAVEKSNGEIQLLICYDSQAEILYVTVIKAKGLTSSRLDRSTQMPDPFVKCYLLPGRCVENQRRTRYFSRSSNPEWNQTMVYPNVTQESLSQRYLEITVWNYDIYRPNEFLGEIILDLSDAAVIDEEARFYKLLPHDEAKRPTHILTSTSLKNMQSSKSVSTNISDSSLSGQSVNGLIGRKMARLDCKTNDEPKKNFEKKFKSRTRRKSIALLESPSSSQNRLTKVPIFPTSTITAHPLMPQGCHGTVCRIL
ncbi:Uncharacterised protein g2529 [Pycnogonum litorale]